MALRYLNENGNQPGYLYVLEHEGSQSFGTNQINSPVITREAYGATHMDDILYLFPTEYQTNELDSRDVAVSSRMVNCLFQFIRGSNVGGSCQLNPYAKDTGYAYVEFGSTFTRTRNGFKPKETLDFWNDLVYNMQILTAKPLPEFPYERYESFQAATWSMLAVILLLVLACLVLASIIFLARKRNKNSMKLRQDHKLEERYLNE